MNDAVFSARKVAENLWWVGARDFSLRDFHGYLTSRGTTYNAFLIVDEKVALIDTVKAPYRDEFFRRVSSVIPLERIDYLISNHAEMDHSALIPEVMEKTRATLVASKAGVKALKEHFGLSDSERIRAVADGETLALGKRTLTFYETKMLHWPDSMFSYLAEEGVLFSQDAFGMHLAGGAQWADEEDPATLRYEAMKYYANILTPYGPMVQKLLARVRDAGLRFDMILPDHGPLWRGGDSPIVGWYDQWSRNDGKLPRVVILYDSMWDSTAAMARAVAEGVIDAGCDPRVMPLKGSHRSDIATELLQAGGLVVGSPTLNNNLYPTVADVMTYLKGLRFKNLVGGVIHSFGWGGEAGKQLAAILGEMGVEVKGQVDHRYAPDDDALIRSRELGRQVGMATQQRLAG